MIIKHSKIRKFAVLQKYNYEVRNAFISLNIIKRPITYDFDATGLAASGTRINVVQGDNINFKITLYDPSNGSQPLTGANVSLNLRGTNYSLDPIAPGVYEYDYSTSGIDTFIAPKTLSGLITIEKDNYDVDPLSITIVVGMTEIFGFPLFYFILIVGGVAAIAGSFVAYRLIQQARIPTFVKKARKMKSVIKSKKSISESLTYPSKEDYLVKNLGDRWDLVGLSLEDTLGTEEKKKMKRESEELKKGGEL